jgi:hypothetical protein
MPEPRPAITVDPKAAPADTGPLIRLLLELAEREKMPPAAGAGGAREEVRPAVVS